jgi:hypothetical protein
VAVTYSQRNCARKVSPMADLKLRDASRSWCSSSRSDCHANARYLWIAILRGPLERRVRKNSARISSIAAKSLTGPISKGRDAREERLKLP